MSDLARQLAGTAMVLTRRDPCTPTVVVRIPQPSVDQTAADSLARIRGSLDIAQGAVTYELNIMHARIESLIAMARALASAGTLPAIPNIQTMSANAILSALKKAAEAAVTDMVNGQINAIINSVTNLAVSEIQRDAGKIIDALAKVNMLLGAVEAEKVLVTAIFKSLDCPAKAAAMAEVYFSTRRR